MYSILTARQNVKHLPVQLILMAPPGRYFKDVPKATKINQLG